MNLLFISRILPTFDRDSGSFRLYQIIRICRRLGHSVTFIAQSAAGGVDPMPYIRELEHLGVTVYPTDPAKLRESGAAVDIPDLDYQKLFNERNFDVAYLYFYHLARQYIDDIRTLSPRTRIIVDSVDVHFLREQRAADLANDDALREQARQVKAVELATYHQADAVIAVTEDDRQELLRELPHLQVEIIPNIHPVQNISTSFSERSGILFVGGFPHLPNVDAVLYFHEHIWPHVTSQLPDADLYLVGNEAPEAVQALAGKNVIVTGYVPDTKPYLSRCRISIAPLRYGAGMKGKVGEALAAGLPVVATSVANEGTGLGPGKEILIADDPAAFAHAVVQLYHDEHAWNQLAANGKEFISRHYSPEVVTPKISESLATVAMPAKGRREWNGAVCSDRQLEINAFDSSEAYERYRQSNTDELTGREALENALCRNESAFTVQGFCYTCNRAVSFTVTYKYGHIENGIIKPNWREHLICPSCGFNSRMRGSVHVFEHLLAPSNDAALYITEQATPLYRWLSAKYRETVGSEFLGNTIPSGACNTSGLRNESIMNLSFGDKTFDLLLSFDVFEHIPDTVRAFTECCRVLKDDGKLFFTVPLSTHLRKSRLRVAIGRDGDVIHLLSPEYHGDPLTRQGCLVYYNFGWDILTMARHAGFNKISAFHFWSLEYGYLGKSQMVFVAEKQKPLPQVVVG